MPVVAYIARDPAGQPWPPAHEHEATAAIGLIQRLHEALHHEAATYAVLANLHQPSADIVVMTELGLGVVELKHYPGRLSVSFGDWYASNQLVKSGTGYANPREQVQAYATRIRHDLAGHIAGMWSLRSDEVATKLKIQTAVCFTNPDIEIAAEIKSEIERDAAVNGRRWSAFQLVAPAGFPTWVSALRFGMEKDRSAQFAPQRLSPKQIDAFARAYFECDQWAEIRNLMPSAAPFGYLTLYNPNRQPQLFPLRQTEMVAGRDSDRCDIKIPETFRRTSRRHAQFTRIGNDVWVRDLGSTHGTFVNGKRVTSALRLKPGQHIAFGGVTTDDVTCDFVFTTQLPQEFQAGATAKDTGTSEQE